MSRIPRIPINEVYFVSKQVCAKRVRERERGREGEASTTRIPINEVYFVSMSGEERERNDVVRRVSGVDGKECEEIGV